MSDLKNIQNVKNVSHDNISRQAVIDALLSEPHNEPRYPDWWVRKVMEIEPVQGGWIPCSERLPDGRLNKSYLVQDKDGKRAVGTYTNWGWMFGHYMNDPVAWMPLPEPYKGD